MASFDFPDLNDEIRALMLDELEQDLANGRLYVGVRLNEDGVHVWPDALADAIRTGDEQTLAATLGLPGGTFIRAVEPDPRKRGVSKSVRSDAAVLLAQGEFNRFYIRAVCRAAVDRGEEVEVYRARYSANPSPETEARVGQRLDPQPVLDDLRVSQGIEPALGIPSHPGSGMSVRLI